MSLESAGNGQPRDTKSRALLIAWLKKPERSAEELSGAFGEYIEADRVIASHPNASADLLEKLSHSTDKATRRRVVGNPNTPAEVYVYLGRQFPREFLANPALDLLLMINPGLMEEVPEALLIRLLKHADCPSSLLAWAAGHAQAKVQLAVLMNVKAPEQALEKLRASKHIFVRESVRLQTQLAGETDPEVVFEQAVRDRLASLSMKELDEAWSAGDIGLAQWEALPLCFRLAKAIPPSGISPEAIRRILMDTNWNLESILKTIPGYEDWYDVVYEKNLSAKLLFILAKLPFSGARESIAKNPLTPAAALEELARDSVYQVRLSVSGNPSAPMDTLLELAKESEEFLESVGKNPSTPLDFLAELASDPRARIRASVAANTSAPTNLLELLSTDLNSAVRQSIAQNLSTPLSILAALAGDVSEEVFLQLARHPSAPLATQKELVMDLNKVYRCDLAKNPATSPTILKVLAKDTQSEVRANAAENPATPIADLRILAGDSNSWIRINVAKNPSTPARVLATLAKDLDEEVRWYVSRHQSTPESSLEVLATDSSQSVKGAVANNPKASGIALAKLANEADEQIRRNVAGNQSTPQDVLEALGHDPSTSVRLELAGNRVVPHGTLSQLANDSDRQIRLRIAGNSSAPKDVLTRMAKSKSARICLELALNPNTPSTALIGLASSDSAIILRTLARRTAHRDEKLRLLLQNHANPLVRFALIENLELDTNVLDKIAQRAESEHELEALLRHPNLSARSAQELADRLLSLPAAASIWYQKQVAKASADVALASQSWGVLSYLGKNPNKAVLAKSSLARVMALCSGPYIEPSRIVRVAGSTDWLVRAAVARNAGTPENLIKKLSADANPLVAQLARSRMQADGAAS